MFFRSTDPIAVYSNSPSCNRFACSSTCIKRTRLIRSRIMLAPAFSKGFHERGRFILTDVLQMVITAP